MFQCKNQNIFNYPTSSEALKIAAMEALNQIAKDTGSIWASAAVKCVYSCVIFIRVWQVPLVLVTGYKT